MSPYLNRWIQPDTIVPQPGNPQDLNRFSYTRNNPLKYTDPTGHKEACGVSGQDCESEPPPPTTNDANDPLARYQQQPPPPEGRFIGLTSNDWSTIGLFPDFAAFMINATYATVADAGLLIPTALGHPEIGFPLYADAVVAYRAGSLLPNSLSTVGTICT